MSASARSRGPRHLDGPQHSLQAAQDMGILEFLLLGPSDLPLEGSHRKEATIGQWQAQHYYFLTCT